MTSARIGAAAVAALGAASAIPLALAQLDFAGVLNAFNIDTDDTPTVVRTLAGVSGGLTFAVLAAALVGAGLALAGARAARGILAAAAVAGLVTATVLWIPAGVAIGAAVVVLDHTDRAEGRGRAE